MTPRPILENTEAWLGFGEKWIPEAAIHYLTHIEMGRSIRDIARDAGCHASTILRRIRRYENRRDDPLVDGALERLGASNVRSQTKRIQDEDTTHMSVTRQRSFEESTSVDLTKDTLRVLRRLAETGAVLAVAKEMEKAVVVRELPGGNSARTTVVDREVAEVMALNEWISCDNPGRIARYAITALGRSALKRMLEEETSTNGMQEPAASYASRPSGWSVCDGETGNVRRVRFSNIAESPITALARRKDKNGVPFLSDDLVTAGERLREDFELGQMGQYGSDDWVKILAGNEVPQSQTPLSMGAQQARDRVAQALQDMGPGLGDVALRCCCLLEGLETAEKAMGWSARSGKVVLRIALQRLKRHYEETSGKFAPMIG